MKISVSIGIFCLFILIFFELYVKEVYSNKKKSDKMQILNGSFDSGSSHDLDMRGKKVLILAPHQDDEALMCSGMIESALSQGADIRIAVMTNGDKKGRKIGLIRIEETIKAMNYLGLHSDNIIFFGYGNTNMDDNAFLKKLYEAQNDQAVIASNVGTQTYSISNKPEYHYQKYGEHGLYNRKTFQTDLQEFLSEFNPDFIFLPSLYDAHPDHSALFRFTVESLINLKREKNTFSPIVYEYLIHSYDGDKCWPSREAIHSPLVPFSKPKTLDSETTLDWEKRESFSIPASMRNLPRIINKKHRLISKYRSQKPSHSHRYLFSYVKSDEFFWKKDFANIAFLAEVSVSSENKGLKQLGIKAVDGMIGGYPRFPETEWVTMNETAGAWIRLSWSQAYTIDRIVLYTRPNPDENIKSATLTFSDGSSLEIGSLPGRGKGFEINFTPKTVTWVMLTINEADGSATGMSEIEVYPIKNVMGN